MKIWVVRNIHTNLFFPEPTGREGRGGSHTEPTELGTSDQIRLFRTKRSASNFVGSWLRGKVYHSSGGDVWDGFYEDNDIVFQPHRHREDVEIIEKEMTF